MNKFLWRFVRKNPFFTGDYTSMEEANSLCKGYATNDIFEKVKNAALAVKNGNACYERDSFLFYETEINHDLLMYLYRRAYIKRAPLNLLDWGGSLASVYFQHRKLFMRDDLIQNWTVVEQKHFVDFGKENLEDEILHFEYTSMRYEAIEKYDCILMSAVLHYLENYKEIISAICTSNVQSIILERTPVCDRNMICIETVKEPIYDASYAMHVFKEEELKELFFENGYYLLDTWKSSVDSPIYLNKEEVNFKSFVFERGKI